MSTAIFPNLVAGEWVSGHGALININPSDTDEVVGEYACATAAQVREAAAAARSAGAAWAQAAPGVRSDLLRRIADEIERRCGELALLLSREEGKALRDASSEVTRAAEIFRYYSGEVFRMAGERSPSLRTGVTIEVLYEPIGVVGLITPWNFPVVIPAWKIAPALAYGNAVLFKPSELVPASAWALADIIDRAGCPKGLFSLLMGDGSVGRAIVDVVDAVSFTGSVATGTAVAQIAASRMIPAQCELGGKNPLVIAADADLDVAVDCAIQGSFMQAGQRCTASSRLIVDVERVADFTQALVARMEKLVIGAAISPGTDIGPVIDERQLAKDLSYIELAETEGARLLTGGGRLNRATPGHFLSPALFGDTSNQMRVNREEIFGPVACIIPVRGYDEALAVANDTDFGLSASIVTSSLKHAQHFKANVRSGLAMVNLPTAGVEFHVPLSGLKSSSYGPPEMGHHAMRFYTKARTAYTFAA
ncbi:aldehyde dehydrogenase family protein [Ancylobacter amanitiformis]|uniref:Aldehyde dehydrogenase (NAD+) n=1 Tax=Ancylobacter amanitiformis TaxID=217069 RepID=A0ABU0LLX8_9HYPH|nr:aldehyde dehydrogenase family protein [Ancylobacter amanitiformis]MDQ0509623.1 aldehyde dehydrogenase (NAD+) [Ancylobacter amanitiformis]